MFGLVVDVVREVLIERRGVSRCELVVGTSVAMAKSLEWKKAVFEERSDGNIYGFAPGLRGERDIPYLEFGSSID